MHRTKILLPGVSVLTRLISTVRDRALKIYGESSLVFQTMLRKQLEKLLQVDQKQRKRI